MTPATKTKTEGRFVTCSRCKGTGEARYNHLNGDTYCYLCDGHGIVYRESPAEKVQREADTKWAQDAYDALVLGGGFQREIFRAARASGISPTGDRETYKALERRLTFWVGEGLQEMTGGQGREREARRAAMLREEKARRAA